MDRFRIDNNSRRYTFLWAWQKLVFGLDYNVTDDIIMSHLWKAFESTCPSGHE